MTGAFVSPSRLFEGVIHDSVHDARESLFALKKMVLAQAHGFASN